MSNFRHVVSTRRRRGRETYAVGAHRSADGVEGDLPLSFCGRKPLVGPLRRRHGSPCCVCGWGPLRRRCWRVEDGVSDAHSTFLDGNPSVAPGVIGHQTFGDGTIDAQDPKWNERVPAELPVCWGLFRVRTRPSCRSCSTSRCTSPGQVRIAAPVILTAGFSIGPDDGRILLNGPARARERMFPTSTIARVAASRYGCSGKLCNTCWVSVYGRPPSRLHPTRSVQVSDVLRNVLAKGGGFSFHREASVALIRTWPGQSSRRPKSTSVFVS